MTDAVVIGAGPNGLAAANALADAGHAVVVLEASDRAGGAVRTEELTLPGFHHDVFSSVYPAGAASPVFEAMELERHGLRWIHPEVAMAHVLDDGAAAPLLRELDATADALDALGPGDGSAWRAFAAPLLSSYAGLRGTMLAGFPPVRGPLRLLAGLGPRSTLDFVRMLLQSAGALSSELFSGDAARAWLYGSAMHSDVPPNGAGSAIFGVYLNLLGHVVGWPSPQGGAGRLAEAMGHRLRALGGEIRVNAPAEHIVVANRRVTGVEVAGGDVVRARIVVADVNPHQLLELTGGVLPSHYVVRARRFRYGAPIFKVDWALRAPVPWTADAARRAGTVHVGGGSSELELAVAEAHGGSLPRRPFLLFGQQSLADPSRAPVGRHTAWAYTHVPHGIAWSTEREGLADAVEAQVERFAPGFRDAILARHVMAPPDLQMRNRNLVDGDVGGGTNDLDQLVFRPVPSLSPYRVPIRGLYLGSASTFPGGSVQGVAGDAAARAAVFDDRLRRPLSVLFPGR